MKKPCYNPQFHRYEIIWANKDGSCGGVWGETEELCLERYNTIKRSDPMIEINTLEVKEVDLEAELNKWRHNHFHGRRDKDASGEYLERISQLELAKHFFELGLKTQKREEV